MAKTNKIREAIKTAILRCFWICPIKKNKIVFSCFTGKRFGDSPRAIAEEIINQGLGYDMVWLMRKDYSAEFPSQIKRKSYSFLSQAYHLATARVWVDSHTKWNYVRKRKKQFYIETWHGGLGKKCEGDAANVLPADYLERTKHNAELADLFISNSKFETEQFRRAFWYTGRVLECGCPKNDIYFEPHEQSVKDVREYFDLDNQTQIALYAPTFRANRKMDCYTLDYEMVRKALQDRFGGRWCVLVRFHPVLIKKSKGFIKESKAVRDATGYGNMQDLLFASDVLFTDYSSPMFEFSIPKKPVFLYAEDYDDYMKDRGWYWDYFDMPFPAARDNKELNKNILEFSKENYERKLEDFWKQIGFVENGTASKTVVDEIKEIMK